MKEKIFFIVGATCTGKSGLAEDIYDALGGSIINFDSVQFYKGLDIGSAKPDLETRAKRPHYLFDYVPIGGDYTASQFKEDAHRLMESQEVNGPYIFVGGSGFYMMALEKGLVDVPELDPLKKSIVQQRIKSTDLEVLYEEIKTKDPMWAERIKPQDAYRVERAILMLEAINGTITELHEAAQSKPSDLSTYDVIKIGFTSTREELLPQVKTRCEQMLKKGLEQEYLNLLQKLQGKEWSPLNSVGYKEIGLYLKNELSEQNLLDEMVKNTLRLAKRQRTWFKRDKEINWYPLGTKLSEIQKDLN